RFDGACSGQGDRLEFVVNERFRLGRADGTQRIDGLAGLVLRTSRHYAVVSSETLSPLERRNLRRWGEAVTAKVLKSLIGGPPSPLDDRMALALETLRVPGLFPFNRFHDPAIQRRVAAYVADGVLEVVAARDPDSPRAAGRVYDSFYSAVFADHGSPRGHLAQISHRAVRWAARAQPLSTMRLRRRLYDFHRLPLSRAWRRRLPDRHTTLRFLGADRRPPPGWRRRSAPGWLGLERLDVSSRAPPHAPAGPFKLYVSPLPHRTPEVLESLWPWLYRFPVQAMKVADSVAGLLRPEKLVVYAARLDTLAELAWRLLEDVEVAAHGVPFSAEIGGRGLVSWGVDRHRGGVVRSWRAWLIQRLAVALAAPARFGEGVPSWRRALERVRLEGVDLERWQPGARLWLHGA
ncbi:MAG: hypothetical protein AAFY88_15450, partial [Acidobacteriota bacterium]